MGASWSGSRSSPQSAGRGRASSSLLYDGTAVNADGNVVVDFQRWVAPGTTNDFGSLGGLSTRANNVSADGQVAVGYSETAGGNRFVHAFRWTPTGGIKDLGVTSGTESIAWGISGDGSVVVGEARDQTGFWRAFRWTSSIGMKDMGTLGGPMSHASEASRDGSVIVGWSLTNGGSTSDHAFWWTAKTGLRDLKQELVSRGVTGLDSWLLYAATGVSDDGSVIVGVALNTVTHEWQPFRAVLPAVTSTPTPHADSDIVTDTHAHSIQDRDTPAHRKRDAHRDPVPLTSTLSD